MPPAPPLATGALAPPLALAALPPLPDTPPLASPPLPPEALAPPEPPGSCARSWVGTQLAKINHNNNAAGVLLDAIAGHASTGAAIGSDKSEVSILCKKRPRSALYRSILRRSRGAYCTPPLRYGCVA
jgi:hypothetical protein